MLQQKMIDSCYGSPLLIYERRACTDDSLVSNTMGKRYFTAEQQAWLQARTSRFLDAQARGRLPRFLNETMEEWVPLWPLNGAPSEGAQAANPPVELDRGPSALKSVRVLFNTKESFVLTCQD